MLNTIKTSTLEIISVFTSLRKKLWTTNLTFQEYLACWNALKLLQWSYSWIKVYHKEYLILKILPVIPSLWRSSHCQFVHMQRHMHCNLQMHSWLRQCPNHCKPTSTYYEIKKWFYFIYVNYMLYRHYCKNLRHYCLDINMFSISFIINTLTFLRHTKNNFIENCLCV